MEDTKLTTTVTVREYRTFKDRGDTEKIADLIYDRFFERYIEPFKENESKHGFSMMAVSCLMIEALFCFKKGRKKTGEAGSTVFENFFTDSTYLKDFVGFGGQFYSNVRCGILHQGETYDGWKILREGALFEQTGKKINATKFMNALEKELRGYTEELKKEPFKSGKWRKAIRKLDHICANCNA